MKTALTNLANEKLKDWDHYIPALLFAYREVPEASTGYSPFELLYGCTMRGPLVILKALWTYEEVDEDVKMTYKYATDLNNRFETISRLT